VTGLWFTYNISRRTRVWSEYNKWSRGSLFNMG